MAIQRFENNGRMSKAVIFNNTLYLCGQTCDEGDIKEQTATVLAKVEDLLNKYGSDKENILSITIYVKDMKDFADMNAVYDAWVAKGHEPARACVEVARLPKDVKVEIEVIAVV